MSIGSVGRYAGEGGTESQNFGADVGHVKHTPKAKIARHHLAKARKAKKVTHGRKATHHRTSRRRSTHR